MPPPPTFPAIEARGLDGWVYQLPEDFAGELNVAVVAFHRRHQADVDTWLPLLVELEEQTPDLRVYEIPCISSRWSVARRFIDGGMTQGIPDPAARARTLTTYTAVGRVLRALGLRTPAAIAVVLVGRDGTIHWRATGALRAAHDAALRTAVAAHVPARP